MAQRCEQILLRDVGHLLDISKREQLVAVEKHAD